MNTNNDDKNIIAGWLGAHRSELIDVADYIYAHPELAYEGLKIASEIDIFTNENIITEKM